MKILKVLGGVIVVLVLAFLAVGLASETVIYDNEVMIDRSPSEVWKAFGETDGYKEWLIGLVDIEPIRGEGMQEGSEFKLVFDEKGERVEVLETVTKVVPNELYEFDMATDPFTGHNTIRFEGVGEKTKVHAITEMHGRNILWRAILRFSVGFISARGQESYDALKKYCESR